MSAINAFSPNAKTIINVTTDDISHQTILRELGPLLTPQTFHMRPLRSGPPDRVARYAALVAPRARVESIKIL